MPREDCRDAWSDFVGFVAGRYAGDGVTGPVLRHLVVWNEVSALNRALNGPCRYAVWPPPRRSYCSALRASMASPRAHRARPHASPGGQQRMDGLQRARGAEPCHCERSQRRRPGQFIVLRQRVVHAVISHDDDDDYDNSDYYYCYYYEEEEGEEEEEMEEDWPVCAHDVICDARPGCLSSPGSSGCIMLPRTITER